MKSHLGGRLWSTSVRVRRFPTALLVLRVHHVLLEKVVSVLGVVLLRYHVHLMDRVGDLSVLHVRVEGVVDVVGGRDRMGEVVSGGGVSAAALFSR